MELTALTAAAVAFGVDAVHQSQLAQSDQLAAESVNLFPENAPLAMLVGLQACERAPARPPRPAAPADRDVFSARPRPLAVRPGLTTGPRERAEVTMLTAAEIRDTQFTMTRRHPGYDPEEVDNFLTRAEAELGRLTRENDELRENMISA